MWPKIMRWLGKIKLWWQNKHAPLTSTQLNDTTIKTPRSVQLYKGEIRIMLIPGSRVLFIYRHILRVGAVLFFMLIDTVALHRPDLQWIEIITLVIALVLASWALERWINYRHNFCIFTDQRIINIKRSRLLAREDRQEMKYKIGPDNTIRSVEVSIPGLFEAPFEHFFGIGTVHIIRTLLTLPDIWLRRVDHPRDIQEVIYQL